ncbi:transposase [Facklamia languida]
MKKAFRTFKKFQPYISNTIDHPPITNGPIEGIHNKFKVLKRNAMVIVRIPCSRTILFNISTLFVRKKRKKDQAST